MRTPDRRTTRRASASRKGGPALDAVAAGKHVAAASDADDRPRAVGLPHDRDDLAPEALDQLRNLLVISENLHGGGQPW